MEIKNIKRGEKITELNGQCLLFVCWHWSHQYKALYLG